MNKSGTGIGSASIALMFAVLCMAILALISYTTARNDRALADAETKLVTGYYEADTMAELIVADILAGDAVPDAVFGVEISSGWDSALAANTAEFSYPISDRKELYVKIAVRAGSYDILVWRMRDAEKWQMDESLPVWTVN